MAPLETRKSFLLTYELAHLHLRPFSAAAECFGVGTWGPIGSFGLNPSAKLWANRPDSRHPSAQGPPWKQGSILSGVDRPFVIDS